MTISRKTLAALALGAAVLIAAGCGSGDDGAAGEGTATVAVDTKGLPKPLAENIEQSNQILDGGTEALQDKLSDLRGYPVVVNQWASWCDPCRAEFPWFADSAEQHAKDVAFLGIDMQDERGAAEDFLAELPVPYPSIFDEDAAAITSGGGQVSPTTVFVDEEGEVVNVRPGAYSSQTELEADIDRYLLKG